MPVWQRFYGDRHAVNLGFTGDATSHLLWRIENGEAAGIDPKVAVILIGANNFGRLHWSAEDSAAGIDAIVTQLRHRLPHTKLVLLGVLPADRSAWATETTTAINQLLAARYGHGERRDVPGYWARVHEGRASWTTTCSWIRSSRRQPRRCIPPRGAAAMAEAIEPTLASYWAIIARGAEVTLAEPGARGDDRVKPVMTVGRGCWRPTRPSG